MGKAIAEFDDLEFTEEDFEIVKQYMVTYKESNMRCEAKKEARSKMGRQSHSGFHESVIFHILVKVSARHLCKNAKLVCKSWNNLISRSDFIWKNCIESKEELLIQWPTSAKKQYFKVKLVEIDEAQLHSKSRDLGLRRMGRVRTSCNGLILVNHPKLRGCLQVINPATKFCVTLPDSPSGCPHKACGSALGFDPYTKEYKVVHIFADFLGFEIFDLGCSESKWKLIPESWVSNVNERPFRYWEFHWDDPVSVNGRFLHWNIRSNKHLISMDICNEKFIRTRFPDIGEEIKKQIYTLVELGGYLSFVYNTSDSQIDIWMLEDFQGQVWSKKHSVISDLRNYTLAKPSLSSSWSSISTLPNLGKLVPLGGANNGEILIFKHNKNSCLYIYNTKNREMKKIGMAINHVLPILPYRSSLCKCTFQGS